MVFTTYSILNINSNIVIAIDMRLLITNANIISKTPIAIKSLKMDRVRLL